jgi:hypothetical protein
MPDARKGIVGAILLGAAVIVGCGVTSLALTDIYMLATDAQPGTPIFLDELAPTPLQVLRQLICGIMWITVPFLVRTALR